MISAVTYDILRAFCLPPTSEEESKPEKQNSIAKKKRSSETDKKCVSISMPATSTLLMSCTFFVSVSVLSSSAPSVPALEAEKNSSLASAAAFGDDEYVVPVTGNDILFRTTSMFLFFIR
jgi:hypothetical protein